MLNKFINWFNDRFNKPYGIEVVVVESINGMFKVRYTLDGNSLIPCWHDYWSSMNEYDTEIISGVLHFGKKEDAIKIANSTYAKLFNIAEEKAALAKKGKIVFRLAAGAKNN